MKQKKPVKRLNLSPLLLPCLHPFPPEWQFHLIFWNKWWRFEYWRHLAKNLLCTAGSKCESKGGRSYLGKTFLYHLHWTWGKDVGHSQYIITYIKSLTCISQCDMFSSCPSPAWLGWSGQLSLPFLWIFTSFLDFYFSISAWLSLFVFCLEPYFLNGIWYFDNHQFISCHDAMMPWCNDASTTECLKGVAAWGEEVEAKQATDWALRCLTDQRPDVLLHFPRKKSFLKTNGKVIYFWPFLKRTSWSLLPRFALW